MHPLAPFLDVPQKNPKIRQLHISPSQTKNSLPLMLIEIHFLKHALFTLLLKIIQLSQDTDS